MTVLSCNSSCGNKAGFSCPFPCSDVLSDLIQSGHAVGLTRTNLRPRARSTKVGELTGKISTNVCNSACSAVGCSLVIDTVE